MFLPLILNIRNPECDHASKVIRHWEKENATYVQILLPNRAALTCSAMTARELDVLHDETVRTAMVVTCPKCGTAINRKEWDEVKNKWKEVEEEGVRRGRETAEYLKSQGFMEGEKDNANRLAEGIKILAGVSSKKLQKGND